MIRPPPRPPLSPTAPLSRSNDRKTPARVAHEPLSSLDALVVALRTLPGVGPKAAQRMALHLLQHDRDGALRLSQDRKSTRLNSSHLVISYAVFCLQKKNRRG